MINKENNGLENLSLIYKVLMIDVSFNSLLLFIKIRQNARNFQTFLLL